MQDPALILHHAELPDGDVTFHSGFRTTTVDRSLIDVAAGSPDEDQLARAIRESEEAGMLTLRRLRARAESVDVKAALVIERAIQQLAA